MIRLSGKINTECTEGRINMEDTVNTECSGETMLIGHRRQRTHVGTLDSEGSGDRGAVNKGLVGTDCSIGNIVQ